MFYEISLISNVLIFLRINSGGSFFEERALSYVNKGDYNKTIRVLSYYASCGTLMYENQTAHIFTFFDCALLFPVYFSHRYF